jgi:chemotaxis protein histidine kinase CheA/methyl-accepting chemotaxis protein
MDEKLEEDRRKKTSIAKRLIIFVVFGNFMIATLFTGYNLNENWKENLQVITDRFTQIEKSSSDTIGTSMYTEDEDQTNKGLEGIMTIPDIVEVKLYDQDGVEELEEGKTPDAAYTKVTKELKKKDWGQTKFKKINVMYTDPDEGEDAEPEKVGELHVLATLKGAVDKIKKQGLSQLVIQITQVIATTFLIFFVFRSLVSRHLSKMAHYADNLDLNDLSGDGLVLKRRKQKTKDELEDVVLSFNRMKDNLKISHARLKDYAENLEEKVKDATKEIEEEKEKVSNLLDNMSQAVFSVNEALEIIGPVSAFTNEVFGQDIIGKKIVETLYKDVGRQTEQFSNIKSALYAIFGENELQYMLMEEHLAERMMYKKIIEEEEEERTFSISYNPLWDEGGDLENLMFIVEDITEREKLAAKVEHEKKANEKNISIITEMANSDIEDISQFLQNAPKLVEDSMVLAKAAPSDLNVLTEMFRYLHTLKGNSRAFNFYSISSITHIAESHVTEIKKSVEKGGEVSREDFNPVITKLYEINSEINDYGSLAKKVFRIENEFEKKIVGEIQNFTVNLDQLISKNITRKEHLFNENQPGKTRKKVFVEVQGRDINDDMIAVLKRNTHSLKGSLRSMNRLDVSEMVHRFEGTFNGLEDLNSFEMEDFSKEFIGNYVEIKDLVRSIYQQSDMNIPYSKNAEDWSEIFKNFFDFSRGIDHIFEIDDSVLKLERLLSDCRRLNFHFLSRVFSDIFGIIKSGSKKFLENKEKIRFQIREIWLYFSLVCRLDYTHIRLQMVDETFFMRMVKLGEDRGSLREHLKEADSSTILVKTLKRITSSKEDPNELFKESEKYIFEEGDRDIYDYFICPDEKIEPKIKMILADFRTTRIVNDLPDKTRGLAEDNDPVANLLVKFFEETSDYLYLKLIDFTQLLNGFYLEKKDDDEEMEITKVEMVPVVVRNIKRLNQTVMDGNLEEIKVAAQRLTDIPVIPSLQKFKGMVDDISTKLNKDVDFKITGNEITLNREALTILQDAFVHLLRNSIDHGIEEQDERRKVGKKPTGSIEVYCNEPDINSIEIKIKDDGAGIDPVIIKRKALEKEIYPEEKLASMGEEEILNIIFLPSFSQKDNVDELSGRGVGMDIVKKNLEGLGGDVKVKSTPGKGTEFTLTIKSSSMG